MKLFLIFCNLLMFSTLGFASPQLKQSKIKEAVKSGEWTDPSTWVNENIPKSGDCIIIPPEYTISVNDKIDYSENNTDVNQIYLHGTLIFDGSGKIHLPSGSVIHVEPPGIILNQLSGTPHDRIRIGNSIFFTGNDDPLKGPFIIRKNSSPSSSIIFSVALQHKKAIIEWATSNELVNNRFELQRNIDMDNWETIGSFQSNQSGDKLNTYKFIDKDKNSIIANYRLKIINSNNTFAYTPVKSVKYTEPGPNVSIGTCTSGNIILHFSQEMSTSLIFKLENLNGDVIKSKKIKAPMGDIDIKLKDVAPGNYMATVTGPMGFRFVQPVKF